MWRCSWIAATSRRDTSLQRLDHRECVGEGGHRHLPVPAFDWCVGSPASCDAEGDCGDDEDRNQGDDPFGADHGGALPCRGFEEPFRPAVWRWVSQVSQGDGRGVAMRFVRWDMWCPRLSQLVPCDGVCARCAPVSPVSADVAGCWRTSGRVLLGPGFREAVRFRPCERRGRDSNPRLRKTPSNGFRDRRIQPLCHPSGRRGNGTPEARRPMITVCSQGAGPPPPSTPIAGSPRLGNNRSRFRALPVPARLVAPSRRVAAGSAHGSLPAGSRGAKSCPETGSQEHTAGPRTPPVPLADQATCTDPACPGSPPDVHRGTGAAGSRRADWRICGIERPASNTGARLSGHEP